MESKLENAKLLVGDKKTWDCLPNASTNTEKYWNGLNIEMIGSQILLWSLSNIGGKSFRSFQIDGMKISLPCTHTWHTFMELTLATCKLCPTRHIIIFLNRVQLRRPKPPCQIFLLLSIQDKAKKEIIGGWIAV